MARTNQGLHYTIDFSIAEATLKTTGPVTLTFLVNDHALDSVHLKAQSFPTPMFGLAITPTTRGDDQKISGALAKLAEQAGVPAGV